MREKNLYPALWKQMHSCFRDKNNALTPVFSASIALIVVSSTMGSVIFFGGPYMEDLLNESVQKEIDSQFYAIADELNDLSHSNPGERNINSLAVGDGSIYVDSIEDRVVVCFSYDEDYEFVVTDIEDTCFLSGTRVLMADGSYKNIEDVKIGDLVLSYNENTGKSISSRVAKVFRHKSVEMTDYYLVINNDLKVTPNHRFYSDGRWVYARDLNIGDFLFTGRQNYKISSIEKVYDKEKSFDLQIETYHNYFVHMDNDNVDVLVHNDQVDQQYYSDPQFITDTFLVFIDSWGAQSFIPSLGNLTRVQLPVMRTAGVSWPLKVSIYNEGIMIPGPNEIIDSVSVDPGDIKVGDLAWTDFYFGGLSLTTGNVYYIVVEAENGDPGGDYYSLGFNPTTGGYTNGSFWEYHGADWMNIVDGDAYFRTFGEEETNQPPYTPSNPDPADDSTNISVNADLSWTGGDPDGDPVTYDVYFGTTNLLSKVSSNQSSTSYDPSGNMNYDTKYYWRIVAWDNHGASTTGLTWCFTTRGNNPPYKPSNPDPENNSINVWVETALSWTGGDPDGDPVTYDVYFGTTNPPTFLRNTGSTTIYPLIGPLQYNTTYYWKIVAIDSYYNTSTGPLWTFTTDNRSITVTSPNGGESWSIDTTQNITWTTEGTIDKVSIWLKDFDQYTTYVVAENISNTGFYEWYISGEYSTGYKYKIKIFHSGDGLEDSSDDYFEITGPSITVTSPNGGEIWPVNSTQNITWTSEGITDNLTIWLTYLPPGGGQGAVYTLAENISCNTVFYEWDIPDWFPTGNMCRIYIFVPNGGVGDSSDDFFSTCPEDGGVETLAPSGVTSSTATLRGKLKYLSGKIRFRYRVKDSQANWTYPSDWSQKSYSNTTFEETITGLSKITLYEYQAGVKNVGDITWGNSQCFMTKVREGATNSSQGDVTQGSEQDTWKISFSSSSITVEMLRYPGSSFEGFDEVWISWFKYRENPDTSFSGTVCIDLFVDNTCFLSGTRVLMADGSYKNIEDVKIGDLVLSYNENTGKSISSRVAKVFRHKSVEMTDYYLVINNDLKVTPNHRFYSDGRWVYARDLNIGDFLFTGRQNYKISSIEKVYDKEKSFDLQIETYHNYFVHMDNDNVDLLAHNDDEHIGTIWIFDSNSLTYRLSSGKDLQKSALENGAIISSEEGNSYVKKTPSIYASANSFSLHALQMVATDFSVSGADSNLKVYSNLVRSNISETPKRVYYIRLQFWGDNRDTWLDYYVSNYQFEIDSDIYNSLKYSPSSAENDGVWFSLGNSVIEVELQ